MNCYFGIPGCTCMEARKAGKPYSCRFYEQTLNEQEPWRELKVGASVPQDPTYIQPSPLILQGKPWREYNELT